MDTSVSYGLTVHARRQQPDADAAAAAETNGAVHPPQQNGHAAAAAAPGGVTSRDWESRVFKVLCASVMDGTQCVRTIVLHEDAASVCVAPQMHTCCMLQSCCPPGGFHLHKCRHSAPLLTQNFCLFQTLDATPCPTTSQLNLTRRRMWRGCQTRQTGKLPVPLPYRPRVFVPLKLFDVISGGRGAAARRGGRGGVRGDAH